jgi:hypothetical protein
LPNADYIWNVGCINSSVDLLNATEERNISILAPTQCNPTLDVNWEIDDTQVCEKTEATTGIGNISIKSGGKLYLFDYSNITTRFLFTETTGDQVFISTGSELMTLGHT